MTMTCAEQNAKALAILEKYQTSVEQPNPLYVTRDVYILRCRYAGIVYGIFEHGANGDPRLSIHLTLAEAILAAAEYTGPRPQGDGE